LNFSGELLIGLGALFRLALLESIQCSLRRSDQSTEGNLRLVD
jgi:hypothetical protein